jgi:hypothetical protein
MRVHRFTAVIFLFGVAAQSALAGDLKPDTVVTHDQVPADLQPLVSFRASNPELGDGSIYVRVTQDADGSLRIKDLYVFQGYGKGKLYVQDVFPVTALRKGRVLAEAEGYEIVRLDAPKITDQGGEITFTVLRDATNVVSDKYARRTIHLQIENGYAVMKVIKKKKKLVVDKSRKGHGIPPFAFCTLCLPTSMRGIPTLPLRMPRFREVELATEEYAFDTIVIEPKTIFDNPVGVERLKFYANGGGYFMHAMEL